MIYAIVMEIGMRVAYIIGENEKINIKDEVIIMLQTIFNGEVIQVYTELSNLIDLIL